MSHEQINNSGEDIVISIDKVPFFVPTPELPPSPDLLIPSEDVYIPQEETRDMITPLFDYPPEPMDQETLEKRIKSY